MKQKKALITGGIGFLGTQLTSYLLKKNYSLVIIDKLSENKKTNKTIYIKADILCKIDLNKIFKKYGPFDYVFHLAAELPNRSSSARKIWETNVDGTINVIEEAIKNKTKSFIFTSSNTLYGMPKKNPVTEETHPNPLEIYGKSKVDAEIELKKYKNKINIQIFRCPVISGPGRLGLQAILYEFISENKKIYILGGGKNKYQFIDIRDLCVAFEKATNIKGFDIYNIGADETISLKDLYSEVIKYAKSKSKIISIPKKPATIALSLLNKLRLSPLGPYQYSMLAESLYADTKKIKKRLLWKPKITNKQMFVENYKWYLENKKTLKVFDKNKTSANKSVPKLGLLKLIKYLS